MDALERDAVREGRARRAIRLISRSRSRPFIQASMPTLDAARARGVVRAQVVARDHRVAPDVLQPAAPQLALRVHRRVVLGVVHALREQALVQALGGLARRHASVRLRRAR